MGAILRNPRMHALASFNRSATDSLDRSYDRSLPACMQCFKRGYYIEGRLADLRTSSGNLIRSKKNDMHVYVHLFRVDSCIMEF